MVVNMLGAVSKFNNFLGAMMVIMLVLTLIVVVMALIFAATPMFAAVLVKYGFIGYAAIALLAFLIAALSAELIITAYKMLRNFMETTRKKTTS